MKRRHRNINERQGKEKDESGDMGECRGKDKGERTGREDVMGKCEEEEVNSQKGIKGGRQKRRRHCSKR